MTKDRREAAEREAAEQRCMDLSAELLRAAHDKTKPVNRDLAIGVAECVAYLLARLDEGRGK